MASVADTVRSDNQRILSLLVAVPGSVQQKELNHALQLAVQTGHNECVRILLDAGAGPREDDASCAAVYVAAVESGNLEAVRMLIAAGKDVNVPVRGCGSVLQCAARWGYGDIVSELVAAGARLNTTDSRGSTPLIAAARECRIAMAAIKQLLRAKCDVNRTDKVGKSALHYCAHKAIGAEVLLAAGADPNIQDQEGNTAMHLAAVEGFDPVIKTLLEYGAQPDVYNIFKIQPIHYLAMKNHHVAIEAIADAGGSVNVPDQDGNSPLALAIKYNRPGAVKALLRANCDTDPPTEPDGSPRGAVPVQLALENKLYGIAKLIILAGCEMAPVREWFDQVTTPVVNSQNPRPFWPEPIAEDSDSDDEEAEAEQDALDWLQDWLHCPHSLQQLSRIFIRRHTGPLLRHRYDKFPLPPALIDYITLKEVEDHHIVGFTGQRP